MCDFSGKLIAWMDGELAEAEATLVERHLDGCAGCRGRLRAYRQVSGAFDAYCDASTDWKSAVAGPEARRGASQWMLMAVGVAAAISAVILMLPALPRHRGEQGRVTTAATPAASTSGVPAPSRSAAFATTARSKQEGGSASQGTVEPVTATHVKVTRREHVAAAKRMLPTRPTHESVQSAELLPARPAIEIAIPSDAMFPPGAVPEGVSFVADVMLGPDGSAERLRLEPQLVRSERRATRP